MSDKPEGPFEDRGKLFDSADAGVANSIDPMHYVEEDGKSYLFWGSFHGIYGIALSADGLKTEGEPFPIAGPAFEAAYLIKRDGYYYFFGSRGSCCEGAASGYSVSVGRSASLMGPYVDKEGSDLKVSDGTLLLTGHFESQKVVKPFTGPGHNAVIRDDAGTDWLVYHAVDKADPLLPNGATRRPLMIDPLVWKDGWPTVEALTPGAGPRPGPVWRK
ncbi:family 43 glycosylhydrolase [Paenibacillus sp. CC-CFT747]|nr:family 43 glycosylhydrolase [Paenibacillus sp. CC-CFT747]